MRYYICLDGGGTKLLGLLVDEELRVVGSARAGGVNPRFTAPAVIREHVDEVVGGLLAGHAGGLAGVYATVLFPAGVVCEALAAKGLDAPVEMVGEALAGLLAGVCRSEGFAALSGTGSDVFYRGPAGYRMLGGWGILLGDEGSGAWIGRRGLLAAVRCLEGWGPETGLAGAMRRHFGAAGDADGLRGAAIAAVYGAPSYQAALAAFAPAVSAEAEAGDALAGEIMREAGGQMALQTAALMGRVLAEDAGAAGRPLTVCGGAWKGAGMFYRAFEQGVRQRYDWARPAWPLFEPVAGPAAQIGLRLGYQPGEVKARMLDTFAGYRYPALRDGG